MTLWTPRPAGIVAANRGLAVVAGRSRSEGSASDGTVTDATYQSAHRSYMRLSDAVVSYHNECANSYDLRASALVGSTRIPLFFDGRRSLTVEPGAYVLSDPFPADVADDTVFWTINYVDVTAYGDGAVFPGSTYMIGAWGEGVDLNVDKTDAGTVTPTTGGGFAPSMILGPAPTGTITVGYPGDSILWGQSDVASISGTDPGFVARALAAAKIGSINAAVSGDAAASEASIPATNLRLRLKRLAGADVVICNLAANDLINLGQTATQLKTNTLAIAGLFARRGIPFFYCTPTPISTSTDSFATVGNQTTDASNAARIAFADWIRDGFPIDATTRLAVATGTSGAVRAGDSRNPFSGYFEVADTVESARNSGKWKGGSPAYTADGLHANTTGHVAAAPAIDIPTIRAAGRTRRLFT